MAKVRVTSSGEIGREEVAGRQKGHTGLARSGQPGVVPDAALRPPARQAQPRQGEEGRGTPPRPPRASALASRLFVLCSRPWTPKPPFTSTLAWLRNHSLWIVSCSRAFHRCNTPRQPAPSHHPRTRLSLPSSSALSFSLFDLTPSNLVHHLPSHLL
jgi:hypothetical protein